MDKGDRGREGVGVRRRPSATGWALSVLAVLAALVTAACSGKAPPSPSRGELRAAVLKAAGDAFEREDKARASGDPAALDGVFMPGSGFEAGLRREITERKAAGLVFDADTHAEEVTLVSLDGPKAVVRLVNVAPGGALRDVRTGRVERVFGPGRTPWRVELAWSGGRWLVGGQIPEGGAAGPGA
jgi:hypothetical protein